MNKQKLSYFWLWYLFASIIIAMCLKLFFNVDKIENINLRLYSFVKLNNSYYECWQLTIPNINEVVITSYASGVSGNVLLVLVTAINFLIKICNLAITFTNLLVNVVQFAFTFVFTTCKLLFRTLGSVPVTL